ncbi:TPA: hypothetical protein ACXI9R_000645, partial [Pseudomonas aeruginosa]
MIGQHVAKIRERSRGPRSSKRNPLETATMSPGSTSIADRNRTIVAGIRIDAERRSPIIHRATLSQSSPETQASPYSTR